MNAKYILLWVNSGPLNTYLCLRICDYDLYWKKKKKKERKVLQASGSQDEILLSFLVGPKSGSSCHYDIHTVTERRERYMKTKAGIGGIQLPGLLSAIRSWTWQGRVLPQSLQGEHGRASSLVVGLASRTIRD